VKTLLDLCNEYGIPICREDDRWVGPCIWSFDEKNSLTIEPENDRWEDWITGLGGNILDFVEVVEARLAHLGRARFCARDWLTPADEVCSF
jgi:hypothetical protein